MTLLAAMHPTFLRFLLPILLVTVIFPAWSCTAQAQRNEEEALETESGVRNEQVANRYREEIDRYVEEIRKYPDRMASRLALIALYRTTGRYDEAFELAEQTAETSADSGRGRLAAGEILLLKGKYAAAEARFIEAKSRSGVLLTATLQLGLTYHEIGRRSEARGLFQELIRAYQQGKAVNAGDLMAVALAARYLERYHDANRLFGEATQADPGLKDAFVAWGRMFVEKYNRAEAISNFEDVLAIDAFYPPALAGLAEAFSEDRTAQAEAKCKEALAINPYLVEAHHLLGRMALTDENYPEAIEHFRGALEVNPDSPSTRALLAACYHAMGRHAEYEAECRRVLDVHPGYGQLYATIADNLSRRYRFREAIEMGRQAIEIDPELWSAHASLGINLSRVGEEEAGRRYLDRAFEHDPFNTWTYNTLNLFDSFEAYTTRRSEHFILKLHRDEDLVYGAMALDLLEEAYRAMASRYGFSAPRPVLVEMFPKHNDFAVRISGLPGAGALLGVCFGEVIVADSPRARPAGSFNWGQTLWHEFAHVIHLQLTRNRIPRWLAEGIAVYETRQGRPEWGIDMEADFAAAVEKKALLKVSDLNSGFTRPKSAEQVILSYYQAFVVVEYIVERYGFEAIRKTLRLYNEEKSTDEIVKTVFGVSFAAFDEDFLKYAVKRTEKTRQVLRFTPPRGKEFTEADLRRQTDEQPESFYAWLFLAREVQAAGKTDEAIEALVKARTLVPSYVHDGNPYRLLATLYQKRGKKAAALRELEMLTAMDEDDLEACRELAALYAGEQQYEEGLRALTRGVMIHPFDARLRHQRGVAFEQLSRFDHAVAEFEAVLVLETTDRAAAYYNLARAYLRAKRRADAKKAALQALEIAPNYEAAQEILLKAVE
ncbi:MAG: tetratricopeptide repeat protein [candidate division Zixibacteria bacterium]|nr:tetratricopeptide repeat protein [candidate division Zixibacteria bacterium]